MTLKPIAMTLAQIMMTWMVHSLLMKVSFIVAVLLQGINKGLGVEILKGL